MSRGGYLFALGFSAALLVGASPASANEEVDRYVESQMAALHIPGLSLAVVRHGQVVKARGYGFANLQDRVPATPETVYEIGSMTKQFTAALVMLLVEEKKLQLGDPLTRFFPDAPAFWSRITVRHLLTHTSGIQNHVALPGYLRVFTTDLFFEPKPTPRELLEKFFALPQEFAPGETWSYDNTGYFLLGWILEQVSGQPYWQLLQDRIFNPLGMTASRSTDPRPIVAHRASGYGWVNGAYENRAVLWPHVAFSAGSILSTVEDLAKWDVALNSDHFLSRESREQSWTPTATNDGSPAAINHGFGWFVDRYRGHRLVQHSGGTPGFSSVIHRYLDDALTVLLLCNHADRITDTLAIDIAGMYVPALKRSESAIDPDPELTDRLRVIFANLLRGEHDPAHFTPPMRLFLATATGNSFWQWFAEHGALGSFSFSDGEAGDPRTLRYAVILGGSRYWFSIKLATDDRVAQITWW